MRARGFLVAAALVLAGCTSEPTGRPKPTGAGTEAEDSRLACKRFRSVASDVSALTDREIRTELNRVERDAVTGTADVRRAARTMLTFITQGDREAFLIAAKEMDAACAAAGW